MTPYLWFLSLAPVMVIIYLFYVKDTKKEPLKTILIAFGAGVLAVLPSYFIELTMTSWENIAAQAFIQASLTEETIKILFFMLFIFWNKEFDDIFDAIFYSTVISLGFAAAENVIYALAFGEQIWSRSFTAVPGHACFAVFWGYFLIQSKINYLKTNKISSIIPGILKGLAVSVIVHGLYDIIAITTNLTIILIFTTILNITVILITLKISKNDRPFTDFVTPQDETMSEKKSTKNQSIE